MRGEKMSSSKQRLKVSDFCREKGKGDILVLLRDDAHFMIMLI